MDIEKKVKEIGEYFKQKVIKGDFEFLSCDERTAKILIDKKYTFNLWIANDIKNNFEFYYVLTEESMILKNHNFKTQKERMAGWRQIKPHVVKYRNNKLKAKKKRELAKLQAEIEKLNEL